MLSYIEKNWIVKPLFFISLIFLLLVVHSGITYSATDTGLVGCSSPTECNVCSFFKMIKNVLDFATKMAPLAAVILCTVGGVWMVLGGGSAKGLEQGKKIIAWAIGGMLFVFGAWLIVGLIISAILPNATTGMSGKLAAWFTIDCTEIEEVLVMPEDLDFKFYTRGPTTPGQGGTWDGTPNDICADTNNNGVIGDDFSSDEQRIIDEARRQGITDESQLAYILATARYESGNFRYMEEIGKGANYATNCDDPNESRRGYGCSYDGNVYYGRGYVQLTWKTNYENFAQILKAEGFENWDIVNHPEYVSNDRDIAAFILVYGMRNGTFTGRGLDDYGEGDNFDFYNARRIINGTDQASRIAAWAQDYMACL